MALALLVGRDHKQDTEHLGQILLQLKPALRIEDLPKDIDLKVRDVEDLMLDVTPSNEFEVQEQDISIDCMSI